MGVQVRTALLAVVLGVLLGVIGMMVVLGSRYPAFRTQTYLESRGVDLATSVDAAFEERQRVMAAAFAAHPSHDDAGIVGLGNLGPAETQHRLDAQKSIYDDSRVMALLAEWTRADAQAQVFYKRADEVFSPLQVRRLADLRAAINADTRNGVRIPLSVSLVTSSIPLDYGGGWLDDPAVAFMILSLAASDLNDQVQRTDRLLAPSVRLHCMLPLSGCRRK